MNTSLGVASRTRSRKRNSQEIFGGTHRNSSTDGLRNNSMEEDDDIVFLEEHVNNSESWQDGFRCLNKSSGNFGTERTKRYDIRNRRTNQQPRKIEIEVISKAEFENRLLAAREKERVVEIESSTEDENETKHDHDETRARVIIEDEFRQRLHVMDDEENDEEMNEAEDEDNETNVEAPSPIVADSTTSSNEADYELSSSSESEDDDSDDETFIPVDLSENFDSEQSSSSMEESDDDGDEMAEFSDNNDDKLCINEEDSVKEKTKISVDASSIGNEDDAQIEVEELQENMDERTAVNHDGLENEARSKLGDLPTAKTRETEDFLSPSRKQKCSSKTFQKQEKKNFSNTEKKKEFWIEDEARVDVEEFEENNVERTTRKHDGLDNAAGSETEDDVPLSRAKKTGETEDLLTQNRKQKDPTKILRRQGKRNFSSRRNTEACVDESERKKKRKADVMEDDFHPIHKGRISGSKSHKTCKLSSHEMEENEDVDGTPRHEHLTKKHVSPRKNYNWSEKLLDSVWDDEVQEEAKQSSDHQESLPLKFRFEDEDPKPVEKSELEIETENLFAELDLSLVYGDVDLSEYQKAVEKDNNSDFDDADLSQYAKCCKGKHYLIEDDEEGLICLYCLHIELEARHMMPPWVERKCRGTDKSSSGADQSSVLNGLNSEPGENPTNSFIPSKGTTVWDIIPVSKQEDMHEHQREGLEFLWKNLAGTINLAELKTASEHSRNIGGCIISHAPGTGKTRLTMVLIETFLKLFPHSRPLIIAPASMLLTWEEEFKKWEVGFPFHNVNNAETLDMEHKVGLEKFGELKSSLSLDTVRHLKIYSWNKGESILGMSYHLFEKLAGKKSKDENLKKILLEKPGLVVLDEGHMPRSKKSKIWNLLLNLKTERRIILSGTPFQNNFEELFNILRIVRPQIAGDLAKEKTFADMIRYRKPHKNADTSNHAREELRAIEELKKAMAPFVHVHKGLILQQSLPGLRDCIVLLEPPPLQKSLIERLEKLEGAQSTFNYDCKVALISVHPYLFKDCQTTEKEREGVDQQALEALRLNPTEGVKTRFLMELVRLSAMRNEKILVFSQYISPLTLIQSQLKEIFSWTEGKHILLMKGKIGLKTRQELINSFNEPTSESKILLASTKCCCEGINLVGASRVVLLDVVWNPSVERQAISRAYRLGQKKIVYTYHLMTNGTTEGDKYCRQAEKERLSELVFTSSSNENCEKKCDAGIGDGVLEDMVADVKMKGIFEKIIYQPKEANLIETFNGMGS